ncbi:unnamed protein product [Pleuronectes platessa]|uniref:Uncharacterized protein n=1 Tax=Pleuronectes platessa TaxID=8262 RepID=A0A9N7YHY7_PLEPL|nr:unnamed protein product [Pleuronectes platessa]
MLFCNMPALNRHRALELQLKLHNMKQQPKWAAAGFLLLYTDDWCPGVGVDDVMSQESSISSRGGGFTLLLRLSPRDKPPDLSCLLHLTPSCCPSDSDDRKTTDKL